MNLAVHHGDAGQVAVGDNLFQADLAVAQKCDEGNEHGVSIQKMIRWILPCSLRAKRRTHEIIPPYEYGKHARSAKGGLACENVSEAFSTGPEGGWSLRPVLISRPMKGDGRFD